MEPPVSQPSQDTLLNEATTTKSPDWRRRCPRAHQAILTAAAALLEEKGYAGVSIEAIAQRAGVGKQTIYRWWTCKAAVIMEAYAAQAAKAVPLPNTGAVRTDLVQMLSHLSTLLTQTTAGSAVIGLIAESQTDLKVAEAFRELFVAKRRAATRAILASGIDRGELRSTLNLDVAVDAIYGAVWYRLLLKHAPLDEAFVKELVDQLLLGMEVSRE
ncbi:MAG TPA: TetR/AcrR family transcriptional regulator [Coleofasciculaceae cyanobacterium]